MCDTQTLSPHHPALQNSSKFQQILPVTPGPSFSTHSRISGATSARSKSVKQRLRTGMIIIPTTQESAGGLTTVGLVTSAIVDNQLIDLDRSRKQLQYHAVEVPRPDQAVEHINGPVERILARYGWGR